ncbi:hypothetical protein KU43P_12210 [Pseudomonas sp. KU43P]|nr:hypothetical protein KU43P_12210 [Pseudomonas sp. KU43P]
MRDHPRQFGKPVGAARLEQRGLAHRGFFHAPRFGTVGSLTELAYDLAWWWKATPGEVLGWTLDTLFESEENAWRINALTGGGNGG